MEKFRKILNGFWKKIYIFAPILIAVFFALGFVSEWHSLRSLEDEILNHPEMHAVQFNEIMMEVYDNFKDEVVFEYALRSGIAWGLVYSALVLYIIFLVTMLTSKRQACRNIGIVFVILTALVIGAYLWLLANFYIPF